jgi:carboxylate-amine ligase
VEEEFFLLHPDGSTASVAPQVLRDLPGGRRFQAEWMQFQVEAATGVCADLASLAEQMSEGRRAVARAAAGWGADMVSSGTAPFRVAGTGQTTDDDRFRHLRERFPDIAEETVVCGAHVHVGVPTRAEGVEVLNRVRGWLPVLLALSGNSPMWEGGDSGWESYRHRVFGRWPTARLAPWCIDEAAYDAAIEQRISARDAIDARSVYWYARLSPRFPTVEFRIADTGLTVADTLLQAALCRALVATALAEALTHQPAAMVPEHVLEESLVSAARYGLGTLMIDPREGVLAPGQAVLYRMVEHLHPALQASGDWPTVAQLVAQRRAQKSGSARQRALRKRLDEVGFVAALAAASLPDGPTGDARAAAGTDPWRGP